MARKLPGTQAGLLPLLLLFLIHFLSAFLPAFQRKRKIDRREIPFILSSRMRKLQFFAPFRVVLEL
jgi:hypothetical protein